MALLQAHLLRAALLPRGVCNHLSAVADDKAPLAVVQVIQPLSSYRTFHLDAQSQPDGWLTCAFPGMLHFPSGFPFG